MRLLIVLLFVLLGSSNLWSQQNNKIMDPIIEEKIALLNELKACKAELIVQLKAAKKKTGIPPKEMLFHGQKITLARINQLITFHKPELSNLKTPRRIDHNGRADNFHSIISSWMNDFLTKISSVSEEDILLPKNDIIKYLKEKQPTSRFVVAEKINKELFSTLDKIPELATPKDIATAMKAGLKEFKNKTATAPLTEDFKKNKSSYDNFKKADFDSQMMKVADFIDFLNDKIDKAKEKVEKAEAEFLKEWSDWLSNENTKLENTIKDSTLKNSAINIKKLTKNKKNNLFSPNYANNLKEEIAATIEALIKNKGVIVSYPEAILIAKETLNALIIKRTIVPLRIKAIKSPSLAKISGINTWLMTSTESNLGYDSITVEHKNWITSQYQAVNTLRKGDGTKNQSFKIDISKLRIELRDRFDFNIGNKMTQPGLVICDMILDKLPKKGLLSLEELDENWQLGLNEAKKNNTILEIWNTHILASATTIEEIKSIKESYINYLPTTDSLIVDFRNAKYHPIPTPKPHTSEALDATFVIVKNNRQSLKIRFEIPLLFKTSSNGNYHAIPNDKEITNYQNIGGKGYEIVNLKRVVKGETIYTENGDLATTPLTFWLNVKDTSSYSIEKEGQVGSLSMINVSAAQLAGLKAPELAPFLGDGLAGLNIKLVGSDGGGIEKLVGIITLMNFKFEVGIGRKGTKEILYAKCLSPFEYQEAILKHSIGATNFDLALTVDVRSKKDGKSRYVSTLNGMLGSLKSKSTVVIERGLSLDFEGSKRGLLQNK